METIAGNVTTIATRPWQVRKSASFGHAIPVMEAFEDTEVLQTHLGPTMIHAAYFQSDVSSLWRVKRRLHRYVGAGEKLIRSRTALVAFLTRFDH